ncbi:hypothetical protein D3C79_918960 [compost metagenome]
MSSLVGMSNTYQTVICVIVVKQVAKLIRWLQILPQGYCKSRASTLQRNLYFISL